MLMNEPAKRSLSVADRRASRRRPARCSVCIECRKGMLGLGRNLAKRFLDLSETGVRLLLSADLPPGEEAEILFEPRGAGKPIKRIARVVWSVKADADGYCVGLHFDKPLSYVFVQDLAAPPAAMR
jgi:hypothetical protein